jgi:hypothetical protein
MYVEGKGVPQDYKEAVKWYRIAAEQEFAKAQYNLGVMYHQGQGVIQDYVSAHMWWNLASSEGHKQPLENRTIVEEQMLPEQIEKAQEMARNWKAKK